MTPKPLKRAEIKKILSRHMGSKAELARRAGVGRNTVSMYLAGSPSSNVDGHAQRYCRELLDQEEAARHSAGQQPSARAVVDAIRRGEKPTNSAQDSQEES